MMPPEISQALSWILGIVFTTALGLLIRILSKMSTSMEELNLKLARYIVHSEAHTDKIAEHDEKLDEHAEKLGQHDNRISRLEVVKARR